MENSFFVFKPLRLLKKPLKSLENLKVAEKPLRFVEKP